MAPPPKLAVTLPSPDTLKWHLQWHHVYCTQQSHHVHSLKVGRHPSSTLQWHPAMAPPPPPTTALQWHPAMAPRPLPQSWSSPSPPPTIAPCNGTQQWHHVHCTLQWHPGATSNPPKWFVALPPIGSKNPYSYRYLGKKHPHIHAVRMIALQWTRPVS